MMYGSYKTYTIYSAQSRIELLYIVIKFDETFVSTGEKI